MASKLPLVRLPPSATIHRFGTPSTSRSSAILRFPKDGLTIPLTSKAGWAIVGDGQGRTLLVETLLSRHRITPYPPPPGPFPLITHLLSSESSDRESSIINTLKPIRHLAFARPPTSGEFTDFTARYGALQEEDKLSFRQTLSSLSPPPSESDILEVPSTMRISHLLDLPSVSLSSGQTRRARIAAALLTKPVLLLVEDPMAGLDVSSRKEVAEILGEINGDGRIRVVLVLRGKAEGMPGWITDVCEVKNGDVWIGSRDDWESRNSSIVSAGDISDGRKIEEINEAMEEKQRDPVVQLQNVSISYGEGTRPVLKDISWSIKPGERWHLQGANGSGKTTLLSLILGHHPRSFSLPATSLTLFSKPRRLTPTPILRTLIGHISPEMYASFPRGMGLTAAQAIGSGFEGVFSRRDLSPAQKDRIRNLINFFAGHLEPKTLLGGPSKEKRGKEEYVGNRLFAHFTPPQQALVLFLRAVVARPPLLILDEPTQGMDEIIWSRCREFLEMEWKEYPEQAVVMISHYEDEVPWGKSRGRIYRLENGNGRIVD